MRAADPDEYLDMDDSDVDDFETVPDRNAAVLTCARVLLEDNSMFSSTKRACEILLRCPESRHRQTLRWERCRCWCLKARWRWTSMLERALVRRGAKRVSAMWEERADQTNMEVYRDTTGECCNRDAVETLSWSAKA